MGITRNITDKVISEQKARDEEERLLLTQKLAEVGFFEWSVAEKDLYWSDNMYRIFGRDPATFTPNLEGYLNCVVPEDREEAAEYVRRAVDDGASGKFELRSQRPNGQIRHVATMRRAILDKNGKPQRVIGTVIDLTTERLLEVGLMNKQAELRSREHHLRNIIGKLPIGVLVFDQDERLVMFNKDAMVDVVENPSILREGMTIEEIMRRSLDRGVILDGLGREEEYLKQRLNIFREGRDPVEVSLSDGKTILVQNVHLDDGGVLSLRINVTAQKISDQRFHTVMENVTVGNIVIGEDGIIESLNGAAEDIFGYHRHELVGRNVQILMPEPDHSSHDTYIKNYVISGKPQILGIGREVTGVRKSGDLFPMHLGIGELMFGDKRSFVGSVIYLSETEHLRQQLVQSQKMEAVGQLTGGIAHDFNNLLGGVMGNLELLKLGEISEKERDERVEKALGLIQRGATLTKQLLAFSRKQALEDRETDLEVLVNHLLELLRRTLGESIEVRAEYEPGLWKAQIDPNQLENAILNLAINSRDAMPAGGELTVRIRNFKPDFQDARLPVDLKAGDYVALSVTDTGFGIPAGQLKSVVEPFYTTKDVGDGSGLGLSMVYGFAKQSGGDIAIDSQVDAGTTVTLYLPRAERNTDAIQASEEESSDIPAELGEKILLVEDDPQVREVTSIMLSQLGYEVVDAGAGTDLEAILQNGGGGSALLISDIILPNGKTGPDILQTASAMIPEIKVLFITGYAAEHLMQKSILDHNYPVLTKPFNRKILAQKVREVLAQDTRSGAS